MKIRVMARKKLVEIYDRTRSISETARKCGTSRNAVRKWVRRFDEIGDLGLKDKSRMPNNSPRRTFGDIQQKIMSLRKKTKEPFTLAQVNTKDALDKSGIGTDNCTRHWNLKLPRYQWIDLIPFKNSDNSA